MNGLASEIEERLQSLEPGTARQFERVLRDVLHSVNIRQQSEDKTTGTLADRLHNHPALGTWPVGLDADAHVDSLRREWGGGQ